MFVNQGWCRVCRRKPIFRTVLTAFDMLILARDGRVKPVIAFAASPCKTPAPDIPIAPPSAVPSARRKKRRGVGGKIVKLDTRELASRAKVARCALLDFVEFASGTRLRGLDCVTILVSAVSEKTKVVIS